MIVTIMQPAYLAWPGFYDRIQRADHIVYLDHVAIDRNSRTKFVNRNRIRTPQGWTWLTIPLAKGPDRRIDRLLLSENSTWLTSHWKAIQGAYEKASHYDELSIDLAAIYRGNYSKLIDILKKTNEFIIDRLGLSTSSSWSSSMNLVSAKDDLILEICARLNADTYISGPFGRGYLDTEKFVSSGVKLVFHQYETPEYTQVFSGFESNMSTLDLLMNIGSDSLSYLEAGGSLCPA